MRPRPKPYAIGSAKGDDAHHHKPRAQEEAAAQALGGRRVSGSGSSQLFMKKGDVTGVSTPQFDFLVECKRTINKSLSIKASWLEKITREARVVIGREPALDIEIGRALDCESTWVAVPRSVFAKMLKELRRETDEGA